ncbi:hypothetical protein BRD56_05475 [Thermoplasmatales archaeon SW_10_69_26]|nr:MAG: hypothetical protein BRD56_05475 [Thermoplasmatales archaeon SW_10_69_26]
MRTQTDHDFSWANEMNAVADAGKQRFVIEGCQASKGTGDLEVDIASGQIHIDGSTIDVDAQTVTVSGNPDIKRYDTITINADGTANVIEGTEEATAPARPEGEVFVAIVEVRQGATQVEAVYDGRAFLEVYVTENRTLKGGAGILPIGDLSEDRTVAAAIGDGIRADSDDALAVKPHTDIAVGSSGVAVDPPGSDREILFNDAGSLGADADLRYGYTGASLDKELKIQAPAGSSPHLTASGVGDAGAILDLIVGNDDNGNPDGNAVINLEGKQGEGFTLFGNLNREPMEYEWLDGLGNFPLRWVRDTSAPRLPDVTSETASSDVQLNSDNQFVIPSSSKRYKTDIQAPDEAPEDVLDLEPKWYRNDEGELRFGFIAEDVAEVLPEVVGWRPTHREVKRIKDDHEFIPAEDSETDQPEFRTDRRVVREREFDEERLGAVDDEYLEQYEEDGQVPDTVNEKELVPRLVAIVKEQEERIQALEERLPS